MTRAFRILVADDDATTRLLARTVLEAGGFQVEEAVDGRRAVAQFRHAPADLVLLDGLMPELDGFAACRAIRDLPGGRHTPILLLSGLDNQEGLRRALECGASDFLRKPLDYVSLPLRARLILEFQSGHTEAPPSLPDLRESLEAMLASARRRGRHVAALVLEAPAPGLDAARWASLLGRAVRREDPVCGKEGWQSRDGGGKGWLLLGDAGRADDVVRVAERILRILEEQDPPVWGARVGYALFPEDADAAGSLLERASSALEEGGRNGWPVCGSDPLRDALARARLERLRLLENAQRAGSLEWTTLPLVDATGRTTGVQLMRTWEGRPVAGGLEEPEPPLDDLQLARDLSRDLLQEAFHRARDPRRQGLVALRLPLVHLLEPDMLALLAAAGEREGSADLEIEPLPTPGARWEDLEVLAHWPGLGLALSSRWVGILDHVAGRMATLPVRTLVLMEAPPRSSEKGPGPEFRRLLARWARACGWRVRSPRTEGAGIDEGGPDEWWEEESPFSRQTTRGNA